MQGAGRVETCWRRLDQGVAAEVMALWRREGAIAEEAEAARRLQEVVCVARRDGAVVGVVTAQPRLVPFLGQTMYYLRSFVAREARGGMVALRLLQAAQQTLASDAASAAPASQAIGILLEIESSILARSDQPVWPRSGFVYAGKSPRGLQRRIWYFPGARLSRPEQAPARPA